MIRLWRWAGARIRRQGGQGAASACASSASGARAVRGASAGSPGGASVAQCGPVQGQWYASVAPVQPGVSRHGASGASTEGSAVITGRLRRRQSRSQGGTPANPQPPRPAARANNHALQQPSNSRGPVHRRAFFKYLAQHSGDMEGKTYSVCGEVECWYAYPSSRTIFRQQFNAGPPPEALSATVVPGVYTAVWPLERKRFKNTAASRADPAHLKRINLGGNLGGQPMKRRTKNGCKTPATFCHGRRESNG
jgi:hypothetical protein